MMTKTVICAYALGRSHIQFRSDHYHSCLMATYQICIQSRTAYKSGSGLIWKDQIFVFWKFRSVSCYGRKLDLCHFRKLRSPSKFSKLWKLTGRCSMVLVSSFFMLLLSRGMWSILPFWANRRLAPGGGGLTSGLVVGPTGTVSLPRRRQQDDEHTVWQKQHCIMISNVHPVQVLCYIFFPEMRPATSHFQTTDSTTSSFLMTGVTVVDGSDKGQGSSAGSLQW